MKPLNQNKMTIVEWLSNVQYDKNGSIFNVEKEGMQMIADVKGWGRLQHEFKTIEEAEKFQDEVGEFIAQAIREKLNVILNQNNIKKSVVEYIESKILYMIPSSLKSDVIKILEQAKEIEKEQSESICVNVIERILDKLEQGEEINSKEIFEQYYNETFKS